MKNKQDWEKVDASKISSTLCDSDEPYEAWKDMPQEAIDYLRSLPEYDADIFLRVTGIDVNLQDDATEEAIKLLRDKGYKIVKG